MKVVFACHGVFDEDVKVFHGQQGGDLEGVSAVGVRADGEGFACDVIVDCGARGVVGCGELFGEAGGEEGDSEVQDFVAGG